MEQTIRLILLAIGAVIVLWILYDGIKRQKRLRGEGNVVTDDANDIDESEKDSNEKIEYAFKNVEENVPNLDVADEIAEDASDEINNKSKEYKS